MTPHRDRSEVEPKIEAGSALSLHDDDLRPSIICVGLKWSAAQRLAI